MIYLKLLKGKRISLESEPVKRIKNFFTQVMNDEIDYCMNMLNDSLSDQTSRETFSISGGPPITFGGYGGGGWRGEPEVPSPQTLLEEEDQRKMNGAHEIVEGFKDLLVRISKLIADDAEDYAKKFLNCHISYPSTITSAALNGLVAGAKTGLDGLINLASGLANMATGILLENCRGNICNKSMEDFNKWYQDMKKQLKQLDQQVSELEALYEQGTRGAFTDYAKENYNLKDPCGKKGIEQGWQTITI